MSTRKFWKWSPAVLAVMMLFAFGCSKKQEVKSSETAPAPSAPAAKEGGIATETLKPETPSPSAAERERLAAAEAGAAVTREKASPFQDIQFDYNQSGIREDAKRILEDVADYLKQNKDAKLLIEGHCDERGTPEYNMALGDRRAASARAYLTSLGIPASAVSTVSLGKEKPLDPGHDEAAWARNRRAHFVLR